MFFLSQTFTCFTFSLFFHIDGKKKKDELCKKSNNSARKNNRILSFIFVGIMTKFIHTTHISEERLEDIFRMQTFSRRLQDRRPLDIFRTSSRPFENLWYAWTLEERKFILLNNRQTTWSCFSRRRIAEEFRKARNSSWSFKFNLQHLISLLPFFLPLWSLGAYYWNEVIIMKVNRIY